MTFVQERLPLPAPVLSGLDAVARYALGFATPTPENLSAALAFVRITYGDHLAKGMADAYQAIWPAWARRGRVYSRAASHPEWRLTENGVDAVVWLLTDPKSSWRRGLSRATLMALARAGATSDRDARRLAQFPTLATSSAKNDTPGGHGWIATTDLSVAVTALLEAVEMGDPLRDAFRGVRAPVLDPSVGRVLWRLANEGLVKSRQLRTIGTQPEMLIPPVKMSSIRLRLGNPPLSPLGERLISMRRRAAGRTIPPRMVGTNLHIQRIAEALLECPTDPVAAISREYVIEMGHAARRIDIAVWAPEDPVGRPSTWVEVTADRSQSGGTLGRLDSHIHTAAAASAAWRQPISLYIVGPSKRSHITGIAAAIDRVATSGFRPGTDLTISVLSATDAIAKPVWQAKPVRTEHYTQTSRARRR